MQRHGRHEGCQRHFLLLILHSLPADYVETPDIDAVIVGVHYGTGRRGGQLAEWTLGLALGSRADGKPPTEFITFCRCS